MSKIHCSKCKKEIKIGDIVAYNECEADFIFCEDCDTENAECHEIVDKGFIKDRLEFGEFFLDEEN